MNRFCKAFRLAILAAAVVLCGCYEGFQHPGGGGNGSGGSGDQKPGSGDKPYGLVIIETIRPAPDAMVSAQCGAVPSSLADVRKSEMDARVQLLNAQMQGQADMVNVLIDEVPLADCATGGFSTIETSAAAGVQMQTLPDALKGKLALHIRLVMWYGAGGSGSPSTNVTQNDWSTVAYLHSIGFTRTLSVNEFAISGPSYGYMWNWKANADPANQFTATVVADPVPSEEGVQGVMAAVKQSSVDFALWLEQRVQGL